MSTIAIYGMPEMLDTSILPDMSDVAGDFCIVPVTGRDRALNTVNLFLNGDRAISYHKLDLKVQDLNRA